MSHAFASQKLGQPVAGYMSHERLHYLPVASPSVALTGTLARGTAII